MRIYTRENPVSVVKKNCHRFSRPGCCEDEVKGVIAIDIARNDLEAANRRVDLKYLTACSGELKLNPIVRAG